MSDYTNEVCLLGLSTVILAIPSNDPMAITGLLAAVVLICISDLKPSIGIVAQVAYLVCVCLFEAFLAFLPVAAYCLMRSRSWIVRLLWLPPLVYCIAREGAFLQSIQLTVLCAMACVLSANYARIASERKGLTFAYDSLRERMAASQDMKSDAPENEHITTLFEDLSPRESAVAQLVAEGLDNHEISKCLYLSEGTVRNYISSILSKKDLDNRTQIAVLYYTG